ncbi:MAG: hypothetical protein R3C11_02540 [Planctomycetaceae bacterium]
MIHKTLITSAAVVMAVGLFAFGSNLWSYVGRLRTMSENRYRRMSRWKPKIQALRRKSKRFCLKFTKHKQLVAKQQVGLKYQSKRSQKLGSELESQKKAILALQGDAAGWKLHLSVRQSPLHRC